MVMYAKIRRMYYREHLSMNEIQRRTSLSRNTIKKWLKAWGSPCFSSSNGRTVLCYQLFLLLSN